jgi:lysophospholipase L1-like esterase
MSKPGEWKTTDGQHFFAEGYQNWGAAIASEVEQLP